MESARRRDRWTSGAIAAAAFVLASGCGGNNGDDTRTDTASVSTTVELETTAVPVSEPTIRPITAPDPTSEPPDATNAVELPERFDAKHITVTPAGDDGLRIREVVDQDFGSTERHGYQRVVPNDFGPPTDVTATSPDAPASLSVTPLDTDETQIRIGDPAVIVTGQHRYTLSYTLRDAHLSDGTLALDIIGTGDTLETGQLEIIVTGLDLQDPVCNVGTAGAVGGCTLSRDGGLYRAVISPLLPGEGVTISGTITARTDPVDVPEPTLPPRR